MVKIFVILFWYPNFWPTVYIYRQVFFSDGELILCYSRKFGVIETFSSSRQKETKWFSYCILTNESINIFAISLFYLHLESNVLIELSNHLTMVVFSKRSKNTCWCFYWNWNNTKLEFPIDRTINSLDNGCILQTLKKYMLMLLMELK